MILFSVSPSYLIAHGYKQENGWKIGQNELQFTDKLTLPIFVVLFQPVRVLLQEKEELRMMVAIGSSIIHIPNKRRRVLIGKYNSKFDLELISLVLNQKDLLLCTKPILPTILINPLRFQELQLQLSEQSALWKLRDDGLGIEGVDAVSEAIIGCSAPM